MRYICCQPANLYFAWQIDIMLYNFRDVGIPLENVDVICGVDSTADKYFDKLADKYPKVNFYFYKDKRIDKSYISSIRPNILKQHFKLHPKLSDEAIFYHDCDILFTRKPQLEQYIDDDINYLSNTKSYIGAEYILSKGQDVFDKMVEVANIRPDLVLENTQNSGGAQYLLKNISYLFWHFVEIDSTNLYREISKLNTEKKKKNPDYHELQIWCADMWGVLWNLWKNKRQTSIINEMNFIFATNPILDWDNSLIYHNAGVTNDRDGLFYKGRYIREIPPKDLVIDKSFASYKYYEVLKKAL